MASVSKNCLICFWEGWLSVAPSVLNAAIRLSERGYSVDVVTLEPIGSTFAPLPNLPTGISIVQLKRARNSFKQLQRILLRTRATAWMPFILDVLDFIRAATVIVRQNPYDLTIGVDTIGILLAGLARTQTASRMVYWSLELDFMCMSTPWVMIRRVVETFERRLMAKAGMIVVQDFNRAALLMQRIAFDGSRVRLVPNSAMGVPVVHRRTFLRERLNIDPAYRIILNAGMISEATMSTALAKSAAGWPEGFILVFHEREIRNAGEPYLQRVIASGGGRVVLSLTPVPLDQVDQVYSSAFIGIVMYSTEHGPNISEIAYASGKLSYFLRNGIPIIVNANASLVTFVNKWQCGVVANAVSEIGNCIARIERDYDLYRKNAQECYVKCLDFRIAFDAVFDEFLLPGH